MSSSVDQQVGSSSEFPYRAQTEFSQDLPPLLRPRRVQVDDSLSAPFRLNEEAQLRVGGGDSYLAAAPALTVATMRTSDRHSLCGSNDAAIRAQCDCFGYIVCCPSPPAG